MFLLLLSLFFQCFFPQNLIAGIRTPLFILNTAYDSWQVNVCFRLVLLVLLTPYESYDMISGSVYPLNQVLQTKQIYFACNQIQSSLAPTTADPGGNWHDCRKNYYRCSGSQIQFLQGGLMPERLLLLEAKRGSDKLFSV